MRSWVRQILRWFSLFVTMLFVLISCSTGDNPISVNPSQDPGGSISSEIQSVSLMDAQSTFEVSYSIRSQWQDGFVADITIENFGDPIDGWTLSWIFPSNQIRITNLWNGKLTQNGANVTVADAGWNARIPSNGQVNFGFQASYRGTDVIPSAFSLNGESLSKPTPIPLPAACDVDYKIRSEWDQGFVADLTLHNLGAAVTDWELSWAFPVEGVQITNLWNGQVNQTGREVKVTNLDWNATIATDGEVDLGFNASHTGGGVTPTEFYLNGLLCNGLPASPLPTPDPSGSPQPSPGSSPTPPVEIPTNALIITNADEVDGTPLQVGQSLTLTAVAGDQQGRDISSQIQWVDQAGTVRGTGPVLVYAAQEVKPETLTASAGSQQASVSFTVSTPDVIVAPHVKVLPDAATDLVESLDLEQGVLRIREDLMLPTLRVGDVVLGATGTVPPVKITALDRVEGVLSLNVDPALPKEVIERGSATFEQTVDWSGETGEVTIVDIPAEPFHIADQLEPKAEGFVQAGEPIQKGLTVRASADVEWQPTYNGTIEFDKDQDIGIRRFQLTQSGSFALDANLRTEGNYDWWEGAPRLPIEAAQNSYSIIVAVGPIPVTVTVGVDSYFKATSAINLYQDSEIHYSYDKDSFTETIIYDPTEDNPWSKEANVEGGQWTSSLSDSIDASGLLMMTYRQQQEVIVMGGLTTTGEISVDTLGAGIQNDLALEKTEMGSSEQATVRINGETNFALAGLMSSWLLDSPFSSYQNSSATDSYSLIAIPLNPVSIAVIVLGGYIAYHIHMEALDNLDNTEFRPTIREAEVFIEDLDLKEKKEHLEKCLNLPDACPKPDPVPVPLPTPQPQPTCSPQPEPSPTPEECNIYPLGYHRGGDDVHNACADLAPPNIHPGSDIEAEHPTLGRKSFDALDPNNNLWEIKTERYSTYKPFVKDRTIQNALSDIRIELPLAQACGYGYKFGVADQEFYDDLLEQGILSSIVLQKVNC
ncbi:MAG: hypothetical protein HC921_20625 [Synechococcaceae cyanobacterium SM2_3_1]|nr:hypothetical protein [Synechococcaceae cyanobacterium SM2_3_1]